MSDDDIKDAIIIEVANGSTLRMKLIGEDNFCPFRRLCLCHRKFCDKKDEQGNEEKEG
jgi:hypothetical protein